MTAPIPMPPPAAQRLLTVYIDLENVVWCHYAAVFGSEARDAARKAHRYDTQVGRVSIDGILSAIRCRWGGIGVLRVFGNPNNPALKGYQQALRDAHADIVVTRPTGGLKNGADIRMVISAMDDLVNTAELLGGVVIVAGDSDFAPLAERLRRDGLPVRGMAARSGTASIMKKVFDEFTCIEVPTLSVEQVGDELRAYVEGAVIVSVERAGKGNPPQPLNSVKGSVKRRARGFSPALLGFGSWEEFVDSVPGVELVGRGPSAQVRRRPSATNPKVTTSKTQPTASPADSAIELRTLRLLRSALATLASCGVEWIDGSTVVGFCRTLDPTDRVWSDWLRRHHVPLYENRIATSWGREPAVPLDSAVRAGLAAKPARVLNVLLAVEEGRDAAAGLYVTSPLPDWSRLSPDERRADVERRVVALRRHLPRDAVDADRVASALASGDALHDVKELVRAALDRT